MRGPIFKPRGRAREFSPLAMDIWNGCDHCCDYCFNKRDGRSFDELATPKKGIVEALRNQLKNHIPTKQVLITFSGDPYCHAEVEVKLTRQILEILCEHNVPVAILSKGGQRCMRDLDLFKRFANIKIGATMVLTNESDRKKWEPNAAPTQERIDVLKELKNEGLQTWASLEPVIIPEQIFQIIENTHTFVDGYKVSKLNYHPEADKIDWKDFTVEVTKVLRATGKPFYIKNDLAVLLPDEFFLPAERDHDAMALSVV